MEKEKLSREVKKRDYLTAVKNLQRLLPTWQQKRIGSDKYYAILEQNQIKQ